MARSARGLTSDSLEHESNADRPSRRVLFVVVEAGAAAYLAPLWRRWLDASGWRVLAGPAARQMIMEIDLPNLPMLAAPDESTDWSIETLLDGWRPEALLISASGAPLEEKACVFGRHEALQVLQFIDAPYNYRKRFHAERRPHWPDHVLVIDERCADEAAAAGLPAARILPIGHPAWEAVRPLPPADTRCVMYVDQPVERHYGDRLGYTERECWSLVEEAAASRPDLFAELLYRPHPTQSQKVPPHSNGPRYVKDAADGLRKAGTILGMFASTMTDALLAGRHVVSIQPSAVGGDMCALSRHGMITRVGSVDALIEALERPQQYDTSAFAKNLSGSCDRLESVLAAAVP